MNRQNYLKQIMVLNEQSHRDYLDDFEKEDGEPESFDEFVNGMLGALFDNEHIIDQIIPLKDGSTVFIIYLMKMTNPLEK